MVSLGCDKNLVDSEVMLGLLDENNFIITDDESSADVIIVNTCCFIDDAKEESINAILEMADYKKTGNLKVLAVTGCMAERYKEEILQEIPEVDLILGTTSYDKIVEMINNVLKTGSKEALVLEPTVKEFKPTKRLLSTGGHFAYLKIAEGCNKRCTYCIIPKLRGDYVSVPMENIISEARDLVNDGVSELILVAQETTVYGMDIYGKKSLHILLKKLVEIEDLKWIRILYAYPEEIYDELIDVIANEEKICNYLDMPIQHCSDDILKRMGRKTSKKELLSLIEKLRKRISDIALRTSIITGFPGETDEEHKELLDFISQVEFDRLGVFKYSREEDTKAYDFPNQIPENIKEKRYNEIMELQQEIAFAKSEDLIDTVMDVVISGEITEELDYETGTHVYIGRTYRDTPGVDGLIFVKSKEILMSGDFIKAQILEADGYDLIGGYYEFTK
jgi:ribosomal protein S12 methylthiotransferase